MIKITITEDVGKEEAQSFEELFFKKNNKKPTEEDIYSHFQTLIIKAIENNKFWYDFRDSDIKIIYKNKELEKK